MTFTDVIMLFVTIAVVLSAYTLLAYLLALSNLWFTFGREGAAKAVMNGGVFSHFLVWWQGHRANDPRKWSFKRRVRRWEILETNKKVSQYKWWQLHWRWLELFGIYWYGLYPFKQIYTYKFEWTEQRAGSHNEPLPWHRNELTDFIFLKNFPYWVRLSAAEDLDNEALDLDYLLTVQIVNPYWALFRIDDWLDRTSADANNKAKMYVGARNFEAIKREKLTPDQTMSEFAQDLLVINTNSVTEPDANGTISSYGVKITAASLVEVAFAGSNAQEVAAATTAKIIAKRNAEARVETAKGDAKAAVKAAKGKAKAIRAVNDAVKEYGSLGLALRQIEALESTADSQNNTTLVWANNPLDRVSQALENFGRGSPPTPPIPSAPTTPPTPPTGTSTPSGTPTPKPPPSGP